MHNDGVLLRRETLAITTRSVVGTNELISVAYRLTNELKTGDRIYGRQQLDLPS
jgi:hypothetical protein